MVGFWNRTKDLLQVSDHVFKVQLVIKCFSQAKVICTGVGAVEGKKTDLRLLEGSILTEDGL